MDLAVNAVRFVAERLGLKYQYVWLNFNRHAYFFSNDSSLPKYYVIFKKDFFRSFGFQFEGQQGLGESINKEFLERAIKKNVDYLLFVYPSKKVYQVTPLQVKKYCELYSTVRWTDKENSYKVASGTGLKKVVRECTYSFPIRLLEQWRND